MLARPLVKAQRREAWGESLQDAVSSVVRPRPYGRSAFTLPTPERGDQLRSVEDVLRGMNVPADGALSWRIRPSPRRIRPSICPIRPCPCPIRPFHGGADFFGGRSSLCCPPMVVSPQAAIPGAARVAQLNVAESQ